MPIAGSWFGTETLPAVVYIHPHCMPATCGPPPFLQLRTDAGPGAGDASSGVATKPTSAKDVAVWLTRTGRCVRSHPAASTEATSVQRCGKVCSSEQRMWHGTQAHQHAE